MPSAEDIDWGCVCFMKVHPSTSISLPCLFCAVCVPCVLFALCLVYSVCLLCIVCRVCNVCRYSDRPTGRLALVFELLDQNIYELIKGRKTRLVGDPSFVCYPFHQRKISCCFGITLHMHAAHGQVAWIHVPTDESHGSHASEWHLSPVCVQPN